MLEYWNIGYKSFLGFPIIAEIVKSPNGECSSFRRKPESSNLSQLSKHWTPVFTGETTFYEIIIIPSFQHSRITKV